MFQNRSSHLKHLSNLNAAFYFGSYNERNDLPNNSSSSFKFPVKGPLAIKTKNEEVSPEDFTIPGLEDNAKEINNDKLVDKKKEIIPYSSSKALKEDREFLFSRESSTLMEAPVKKRKVEYGEEVIGILQKTTSWKKSSSPGSFGNGDKVQKILGGKFLKNKEIVFFVEWKFRKDGTKPGKSRVTSKELRKYDADFLLDFYESRFATYNKKDGDDSKLAELLENLKKKEKRFGAERGVSISH